MIGDKIMEESLITSIINKAASEGTWALLFVGLFVYVIKDSKQREGKYQEMVAKLHSIIDDTLKSLGDKVDEILNKGGK